MQQLRAATLCALLMAIASSALAQKFTGVIKQQAIEIFNETVLQIGGEISGQPTPEQEAYGFDPESIMKMSPAEALTAANEVDGSYTETINMIYIGDAAVRADFQTPMDMANNISYILRQNQNTTLLIFHARKKYVELTSSEAPAKEDPAVYRSAEITSTPFRKTGDRMIIDDVECERYLAKDSEGMRELWMSDAYGDLRTALDLIHEEMIKGVTHEVATEDDDFWNQMPVGFPVVVKELTPGGSLSIESIQSVKRQPVDAKLFEIPAGYKKITLTEMMKMQMEIGEGEN